MKDDGNAKQNWNVCHTKGRKKEKSREHAMNTASDIIQVYTNKPENYTKEEQDINERG